MIIETFQNFITLTAEDNKIFRNKNTGDFLSEKIYLGCNDITDNYEEVEKSVLVGEDNQNQNELKEAVSDEVAIDETSETEV